MAEFDIAQALHDARMLAEKRHSEIMLLQRVNDDLIAALEEIIAHEDKAWMPVRAFQSYHQVELDDAKHQAWQEAAEIARSAIAAAKGEGAQ